MSIFEKLFPRKTDKELQAELKALVDKIVVNPYHSPYEFDRYESLLKEIYNRGLEPETKLVARK